LERGKSIGAACRIVSIAPQTYYDWKKRAERGEDEYILLMRRLIRAREKGADACTSPIWAAAEEGDWKAAAWLAQKLYPSKFGNDAHVEEIELDEPEAQVQLRQSYSSLERMAEVVKMMLELNLVTPQQLGLSQYHREDVEPQPEEPRVQLTPQEVLRSCAESVLHACLTTAGRPVKAEVAIAAVVKATGLTTAEVEHVAIQMDVRQDWTDGGRPDSRVWSLPGMPQPVSEPAVLRRSRRR